jgi:hypothetical protein
MMDIRMEETCKLQKDLETNIWFHPWEASEGIQNGQKWQWN